MYEFDGSFGAPNAIPPELTILIDSIINGGRTDLELGFSLPVETIAQLIVYNHRSRKASKTGHQRHNADREMPSPMYIGLKLYSATRSRKIIDILYKHGLCVV